MIAPFSLYKLKRILLEQWSLLVSVGVFIVLVFIVLIFYARCNAQTKDVELLTGEVRMLKNRYDTLKYNKSITEDQIKEYNKLLASLVPETEDYFSIIYALEEISAASGFVIKNYTIDVRNTTNERLTLSVEGQGNTDSFLAFLQEYQFAGGRLATSDKIQYGGANSSNTRVTLIFYSKTFTFDESVQVPQFSKEELAKLEVIKQKVKFQFSSNAYQSISTDYEVKKNPFNQE